MTISSKKTLFALILGATTLSNLAIAEECDLIQFIENKSPGSEVLTSNCSKNSTLSLNSQLSIAAGGRLWLESYLNKSLIKQQLICQNRSKQPIQLEITGLATPWVEVKNISNCDNWIKNRLSCDISTNEKFFCITGNLKQTAPVNVKQERTTSVSMRGINDEPKAVKVTNKKQSSFVSEEAYINAAITKMQPEINLCRELLDSNTPIEIFWNIKAPNKIRDLTLLTEKNDELGSCMQDVIANYPFPETDETILFAYEF